MDNIIFERKKQLVPLISYLYIHGISIGRFAEKIKKNDSHFRKLTSGKCILTLEMARLIEKGTNGEVTAKALLFP